MVNEENSVLYFKICPYCGEPNNYQIDTCLNCGELFHNNPLSLKDSKTISPKLKTPHSK
jgi:hypothetical protein